MDELMLRRARDGDAEAFEALMTPLEMEHTPLSKKAE